MPLENEVGRWCKDKYQLEVENKIEQTVMRHTFSHFHLDITPCLVEVNNPEQSVMEADRIVWYKASQTDRVQPALGLAAPVTNLLNRLYEEEP